MYLSIFAETIITAIKDYRSYLRKTMKQADRMNKLSELHLKEINAYSGDIALYHKANEIVADIEKNLEIPEQGYYSYSGIEKYCLYLKNYLQDYAIEDDKLVHKAQFASRAILDAIQMVNGKPAHTLTDQIKQDMQECQAIIAKYGNEEQFTLYVNNINTLKVNSPLFFTDLLRHFNTLVEQQLSEAA